MARCDSHFQHGLEYRCYALEHPAVCSCGGDQSKCDFFPFLPEKRTPKQKPIHCKDCLHNPVCELWRHQEAQDASSFQLSGCDHFKDSSMFVELPCRIGDDIWWINDETKAVECAKADVAGFVIKDGEILIRDAYGGDNQIGSQYCYLTKADAEAALANFGQSAD